MQEGLAPALLLARVACVLGLLGVGAGAFGAHGLREHVTAERLKIWETGIRYLLLHVPVLLGVAVLMRRHPSNLLWWSGVAFVAGMVVFTGSLVLLVLLDRPFLGAVTPLGGVSLMLGWALLFGGVGRALR